MEKDDIDLIAERGDEIIAVQLETGKSDIKRNIQTLMDHKANQKLVIATNKQTDNMARHILSNFHKNHDIEINSIKDYISQFKSSGRIF